MHYCDKCRINWDWPEYDAGPIDNCDVCGERGKLYYHAACALPLPDHRRLQVLTKEELPKEWADCMQVAAAISTEILQLVEQLSLKQDVAKKHTEYIRALNKLYFGGEL